MAQRDPHNGATRQSEFVMNDESPKVDAEWKEIECGAFQNVDQLVHVSRKRNNYTIDTPV